MTQEAQGLVDVGKLVLAFAKIKRVTLWEDGVTKESDTDHTVMLSIASCALASKFYPSFDLGKIAQYAIIHDLVEVYVGDTDSVNLSSEAKAKKDEREHEAFLRIEEEFKDTYPWIAKTLHSYEKQDNDEALFVKLIDKLMPKVTLIINRGAPFKNASRTEEDIVKHYATQTALFRERFGAKFPEILEILEELMGEALTYVPSPLEKA